MTLGSISILGWAFLVFVMVVIPLVVLRNRDSAMAMASIPLTLRFQAMLIPQIILGALAVITGVVEDIELFPARVPSLASWFAGLLFLAVALILVRSEWRRSIEEPEGLWRLFAPANRREGRMWVGLSLSAGIGEELVWRGVLPALVASITGSLAIGVALSVLSFALAHAIQGPRSVLAIAAIAGGFHAMVFVSGSLYVAMVVHFVYDVIAGFTYARLARERGLLAHL